MPSPQQLVMIQKEFVFVNSTLYRITNAPYPNMDGTNHLVKDITPWYKKTIKEDLGKGAEQFIKSIASYKTIHQAPEEIQVLLKRRDKLIKQGYLN